MLKRRRMLNMLCYQNRFLPDGWWMIPYITTNAAKNEHINTLVYGDEDIRIEMESMLLSSSYDTNNLVFFSSKEGNKAFSMRVRQGNIAADFGDQILFLNTKAVLNTKYKVVKNGKRNFINDVEYPTNSGDKAFIQEHTHIFLSDINLDRGMYSNVATSLRIYGCKIYRSSVIGEVSESDELLRDYIPVSNGIQEALYDMVNGELYYKNGSCDYYHHIDYAFNNILRAGYYEYYDTGFNTTSKLEITMNAMIKDYPYAGSYMPLGAEANQTYKFSAHSWEVRGCYSYNIREYKELKNEAGTILKYDLNTIYELKTYTNQDGNFEFRIKPVDSTDVADIYKVVFSPLDFDLKRTLWIGGVNYANSNAKDFTGIRVYMLSIGAKAGDVKNVYYPMSNGAEDVLYDKTNDLYIHQSLYPKTTTT